MTNKQRLACLQEACNYSDRDAYISDMALSIFQSQESDEFLFEIPDEYILEIGSLYDAARQCVKEIAAEAGISQRALAERFAIPYRTVENWCANVRECPVYVKLMMQEVLGLLKV